LFVGGGCLLLLLDEDGGALLLRGPSHLEVLRAGEEAATVVVLILLGCGAPVDVVYFLLGRLSGRMLVLLVLGRHLLGLHVACYHGFAG
jgi:hypothetical protein